MKTFLVILVLIGSALSAPQLSVQQRELNLAESCDPSICKAPSCRCSSTQLQEGLSPNDIPQLVMLTFDDAVTSLNFEYYKQIFDDRTNPDGCPIQGTFFVSHEYTDYSKVHELWSRGHEIALHSITHNPLVEYWRKADVELLKQEFGKQREQMAYFAQIAYEDLKGIRLPLFEMSGNNTFEMMAEEGFLFDSSWASQHFIAPGMWPYSLDYASTQDCPQNNCPTASIQNVWVNPILMWNDVQGHKCAMVDACGYLPEDDEEELFNWMVQNFEHSYKTNKAPFGVYLHSAWFLKGVHYFPAYIRFIEYLNTLPDVYFVSGSRTIQYVKSPKTGKPFDSCQKTYEPTCEPKTCQLFKFQTGEERWMTSCTSCPTNYPWLENPLGEPLTEDYAQTE